MKNQQTDCIRTRLTRLDTTAQIKVWLRARVFFLACENYAQPALKKGKKKWRSARAHPLDQSTAAQGAEMTVDELSLTSFF